MRFLSFAAPYLAHKSGNTDGKIQKIGFRLMVLGAANDQNMEKIWDPLCEFCAISREMTHIYKLYVDSS